MHSTTTRREFLSTSGRLLGGGWMALSLPTLAALSACAREAAERGEPFTTLSPEEGRTVAAFAARVIPSDDSPGATEAGAVHFVDQALGTHFEEMLGVLRPGLRDLDERARALDPAADGFADLSPERQDEAIRAVQETPFFFNARLLVVMGVFADPKYGGNRDGVGHELLGMEHRAAYEPPFGHYDAEHLRQGRPT